MPAWKAFPSAFLQAAAGGEEHGLGVQQRSARPISLGHALG